MRTYRCVLRCNASRCPSHACARWQVSNACHERCLACAVQALPTHVPLPNTFSKAELKELEEPKLARAARKRVASAKRRLSATVIPALEAALPDVDRSSQEWIGATSLDTYLWAVNLVGSRALTIQGRKYLVPFADMFNYAPHHQQRDADSGANFLKCDFMGRSLDTPCARACTKLMWTAMCNLSPPCVQVPPARRAHIRRRC